MLETYGNYELIEHLATGGMAEIFKARQLGLEGFEKELVIKRILPNLARDPSFVRMFLDEARIAARLNHPNVAQIYNLGAQGGTYFISMEYLDGPDLRVIWRMCEERGEPMPPQHACRIVAEVAAALQHAHQRTNNRGQPLGIIHRDVSPQNILVSRSGQVKVVDFGIAKAADSSEHTRVGVLKGKFAYMAPEQAAGQRIDQRIDIFALGVILHELLTGERLFKRDNDAATLTAVGQCKVPEPSSIITSLPKDLDAVVLKALKKRPSDRYQHAADFQVALEQWALHHQLKSGPAQLGQFVIELEAEDDKRLAHEEALKKQAAAEKKKSHTKQPKARAQSKTDEATRPLSDVKPPPPVPPVQPVRFTPHITRRPAQGAPTQTFLAGMTKRQVGLFAFLLGVSLVAIIALATALWPRSPALVRVQTQPEGAAVVWNGKALDQVTPCTVPTPIEGTYTLELRLSRYETYKSNVTVPAHGTLDLAVVLKPDSP